MRQKANQIYDIADGLLKQQDAWEHESGGPLEVTIEQWKEGMTQIRQLADESGESSGESEGRP